MKNRENFRYEDILYLPHHTSKTKPRMSVSDRAAQFSPFAALTGYEDAVKETARLTAEKIELDENEKAILDSKLQIIAASAERTAVTITYFKPDAKKAGGAYVDHTGIVKKIDDIEQIILMTDKTMIPIDNILAIESDIFNT